MAVRQLELHILHDNIMTKTKRPLGLQAKLILAFTVLGMLPLIILALITLSSSKHLRWRRRELWRDRHRDQ